MEIAEGLSRIARAKAIASAIEYHKYLARNFNAVLRKNPQDIVETAKVFIKFIEEIK